MIELRWTTAGTLFTSWSHLQFCEVFLGTKHQTVLIKEEFNSHFETLHICLPVALPVILSYLIYLLVFHLFCLFLNKIKLKKK